MYEYFVKMSTADCTTTTPDVEVLGNDSENATLRPENEKDPNSILENGSDHWKNKTEYILSVLGISVGLGNLYRFPYLCLRNGGAAFLVPYVVFLIVVGMPLFLLEMYMGQYSGLSVITVWNICPVFQGSGYALVFSCVIIMSIYSYIMGWCMVYAYESLHIEVPWKTCSDWWNTITCFETVKTEPLSFDGNVFNTNGSMNDSNGIIARNVSSSMYFSLASNTTAVPTFGSTFSTPVSAAQEFYENKILGLSSGIADLGNIQWHCVAGAAVTLIITFLATIRGVRSIGKFVYVTAIVPYILLTALLIRGCSLPGSWDGIKFYLIPDMDKLLQFNVWFEALMQIFLSLGPGWGGIITTASCSDFHGNFIRMGTLLTIGCALSSFYGGFVTFSVLGFLAKKTGKTVENVARSGPGLAFITYPEALAQMPLAPIWSFIFFMMLFNVGLESNFIEAEIVSRIFANKFSCLKNRRILSAVIVFIFMLIISFPIATGAGVYIIQIVEWYLSFTVMAICLFECISVSWFYGISKTSRDVLSMTGKKLSWWWRINWCIISPLTLSSMMVYSGIMATEPYYGSYTYPSWAIVLAWTFTLITFLPIPIMMVVTLLKETGTLRQRLKKAMSSTSLWSPQEVRYHYITTQDAAVSSV